jgi:hypothetical protein
LNATANTPGTFVYSPGEGTFLAAGTQTLSVTFTPADTTHFAVTKDTVSIVVSDPTSAAGKASLIPQSVQIVGGGYVDGVYFHPKQQGLRYAKTDVGGAYRWQPQGTPGTSTSLPTCPGYPTSTGLPPAPKGNSGEFLQCGYWVPLLDFLGRANAGDMGVESLALDPSDPQRLYLSTGLNYNNDPAQQNHFYLSGDQGNTFTVVNAPFPINGNANGRDAGERMAVDPNQGTTIYYGTRTAGLWKSLDRGNTWNQVTSFPVKGPTAGAGVVFVKFVAGSGTSGAATPILYAGVSDYNYYNADGSNNGSPLYSSIYQSVDAGVTWQSVPGQPTSVPNSAGSSPANYNLTPIHAVVGADGVSGSQGSLYVTYFSDQGPGDSYPGAGAVYQYTPVVGTPGAAGTWTNITPTSIRSSSDDGGYSGLTLDAERPGVVMVSTMDDYANGDAIYRSLDYGRTWRLVEQGTSGAINDIAFSPWITSQSQKLYVGTENWPSALSIDPFDSNHAVYGTGETLWDTQNLVLTDVNQQPVFSVGAYGSASSGVKQVPGGSSIEETVVLGLASPPTGAFLLSAVGDIGTFAHLSLDTSPVLGASVGPLFTTGTSVDFAQNAALTVVRVGSGVVSGTTSNFASNAPSFQNNGMPCPSPNPNSVPCTQVQVPLLLATTTTQGASQTSWIGYPTLFDAPNLASVTPTTKLSAGGGTVAISPDASSIVWATTDFPPACSADGGQTFTPAVNGIIGAQVVSDRATPGKYYMYDSASGKLLMGVATLTTSNPFLCHLTFNTQATLPAGSQGQLAASFGGDGDIWLAVNGSSNASANGIYHSTDSGKTLTNVGSFTQAYAVGLGAPATSSATAAYSKPAAYIVATGASGYGFYRSIDNGATWVLVSNPAHLLGTVNHIVGDPRKFGRYYLGTGGRGIAYADSQ